MKSGLKKKTDSVATVGLHASLDKAKWVLGILLVAGAVIGFTYYAEYPFLYRLFALLACFLAAAFLFWHTERGKMFLRLMRESKIEISKVVWPARAEVWQTSLMVSLVALVAALVFWLSDMFFGWLVRLLIGW